MKKEKGAIWKFSAYGFLKNQRFFEPFILLFFLSRGLSYFQVGLLISIKEIFVNILEILTGAFADVYGKKKSMVTCFFFYIISFFIFYGGRSFLSFSAAMFFFALGETLRSGTHKSIIMDYLERHDRGDQKIHVYGLTRSYSKLGSALSALIAAGLVFYRGDYGIVFLFSVIPYLGGFVLMLTYPDDQVRSSDRSFVSAIVLHLKETIASFKKTAGLTTGVLNLASVSAFFKITRDYLQPILRTWALALPIFVAYTGEKRSALVIGVVYLFIYLAAALASRNAGNIYDRLKLFGHPSNLFFILNIVIYLSVGCLGLAGITFPVILLFLGLYFIRNVRKPMVVGYISEIAAPAQRATVLSMENQLRSILALLLAPVIGLVADRLGVPYVFVFAGLFLSASYLVLKIKHQM